MTDWGQVCQAICERGNIPPRVLYARLRAPKALVETWFRGLADPSPAYQQQLRQLAADFGVTV